MKTIFLKIINWLLKFNNPKSHFFMVSQSKNKTYIFVDGKRKSPVSYFINNPLTVLEQAQLDDIIKTYLKLINK